MRTGAGASSQRAIDSPRARFQDSRNTDKPQRRRLVSKTARLLAVVGALALAASAFAATPLPIYVQFPGAAKGALYYPDPAKFPSPHVGVIVMHRNSNYLNHISTRELPARGFVVLGMNP